jgi:hypothetical protein
VNAGRCLCFYPEEGGLSSYETRANLYDVTHHMTLTFLEIAYVTTMTQPRKYVEFRVCYKLLISYRLAVWKQFIVCLSVCLSPCAGGAASSETQQFKANSIYNQLDTTITIY